MNFAKDFQQIGIAILNSKVVSSGKRFKKTNFTILKCYSEYKNRYGILINSDRCILTNNS